MDDLIRGILLLAEGGEHLPVNIGNPGEFTILELAQNVLEVTGSKSEIVFEALPVDDPAGTPARHHARPAAARLGAGDPARGRTAAGCCRLTGGSRSVSSGSGSGRRSSWSPPVSPCPRRLPPEHEGRDLRRGRDLLRRPGEGLRGVPLARHADPPRQPVLGRQARRREVPAVRRARTPGRRLRLGALRPRRPVRGRVQASRCSSRSPGRRGWANGGQSNNRAPKNFQDLYGFAYAAAARYSGSYTGTDGRTLPAVRLWAAWNEPNNPVFLRPQFSKAGGKWVIQSAIDYAKICNAVYGGVHATMLQRTRRSPAASPPRAGTTTRAARPPVGIAGRLPGRGEEGGA